MKWKMPRPLVAFLFSVTLFVAIGLLWLAGTTLYDMALHHWGKDAAENLLGFAGVFAIVFGLSWLWQCLE